MMNLSDLAATLATASGTTKAEARKHLGLVFDTIAQALASGQEVSISGFGKFSVRTQAQRVGRNPATGKAVTIAASRKPKYVAAKSIKDRLNA